MDEAKFPRKSIVDWEAMDIFLFTNGEEGSPPRKYHLKTEELDWWDATLSYLAQSHYGSLHSVLELYTTDGTKVENPMQLSNGAAYVAVVPPNPFISAGYDNYLLKATRSRDKRHKNTTSSNESVHTEDNAPADSKTDDKLNEAIANTSTPKDKNIKPKGPVKQNSIINRRPPVKRNIITPVKKNDLKSGSLENTKSRGKNDSKTVASPLLSRKNVTYPPKVTTKSEKEEHKNLEFSPQVIKEERNSIGINNTIKISNKSTPVNELLNNTLKSNMASETKEINSSPTTQFLYPSQQTAITLLTPKITGEREKTSVPIVFLNQEQEFISSGNIQPTNHQESSVNINMYAEKVNDRLVSNSDDEIIKFKKKEFETIIDNIVEKILSQKIAHTSTPFTFENNKKFESFKPSHSYAKETIIADDDRNKIITIAHNGEVVNLKLNIEVANVEPASTSAVQVKSMRATSNVFMAEKSSQANSDFILHASTTNETNEILQGFNEECTFHTLRNDDSLHCDFENCDYNLNAVLVQCLCCNNKFIQENNSDVQYVIIVPSKSRGNLIRCKCKLNESSKRLQIGICKDTRETYISPILKDACCKGCTNPTDTNHTKQEETIAKFESVISRQQSTISMTQTSLQRSELSINKYVSKTDRNINFSKDKLFQNNQTESIVAVRRKSKDNFPRCVVDAATQTDWCNVLLEARPQQDGHYTFHFPPLSVLRYYT